MKKYSKYGMVMVLVVFCLTAFIYVVKADDEGTFQLNSLADVQWTKYNKYSKPTKIINYTRKSGTGEFNTKLQTKGLFGYKNVSGASTNTTFKSDTLSESVMFTNVASGNYRFYLTWKNGDMLFDFKSFSS